MSTPSSKTKVPVTNRDNPTKVHSGEPVFIELSYRAQVKGYLQVVGASPPNWLHPESLHPEQKRVSP